MNYSELNKSNKLLAEFITPHDNFKFLNKFNIDNFNSISEFDIFSTNKSSKSAYSAISESMSGTVLSDKQMINLDKVQTGQYFAVVTGQQPGFLGGADYSIFKALTAIKISEELNNRFNSLSFIPIFWIEDNDHDAEEAAKTILLTRDGNLLDAALDFDSKNQSIASRTLNETDLTALDELLKIYESYGNYDEIKKLAFESYKTGTNWSDAFQSLINSIIGETGILFVSAEKTRKLGLFKDVAIKELLNFEKTFAAIDSCDAKLTELGYKVQAKNSKLKLFYHFGDQRFKLEPSGENFMVNGEMVKRDALLSAIEERPWLLSPNVLLRPVVQDSIFSTAVYAGGPGELGYMSQLNELYAFFNIPMPYFALRTGATFIDKKSNKFCEKYEIQISELFDIYPVLEKKFTHLVADESTELLFNDSINEIKSIFNKLTDKIKDVDLQLEKTAVTALDKSLEQIDNLHKKTTSFQKRKNDEFFAKLKSAANFVYPNGKLQERAIAPFHFAAICGIEQFKVILMKIKDMEYNGSHHFVELY